MMKKCLIGIFVLITIMPAPASAGMCSTWQCGKLEISACVIHEWNGGGYEVSFRRLQNPALSLRDFKFKFDQDSDPPTASLNGKSCKSVTKNALVCVGMKLRRL